MRPTPTRRPGTSRSPDGTTRGQPRLPFRLLSAALAAPLLLAGCASTGARLNEARTTPVAVPADRLWLELEDVYRDLGLPLSSTDPRARVARSGNVAAGSLSRVSGGGLVSCPALPDAPGTGSESGALLRVTTTLRPVDGFTDVVSRVEAWRDAGGTRPRPVECRSTGVLERRIAELLQKRT